MTGGSQIIVKRYEGKQDEAAAAFQRDAVTAAADGYYPISQNWQPGSWGCGAFLIALILCVVLVGFLVFVYLLIVKPAGTLVVTYQFRGDGPAPIPQTPTYNDHWQR